MIITNRNAALELEPAISKYEDKSYSLQPDMINGWRAKARLFRQLPIRFYYEPVDLITKQYTRLGHTHPQRVLYLGARYTSNLRATRSYASKQYDKYLKESFVYPTANRLKKFQYKYLREKEKNFMPAIEHRIFTGMNPTIESDELSFDSDFECGNLDLVMKVSRDSYDLFMRVDTNTKGHTSWFFFKVKNNKGYRNVKFNICNFTKKNLLYCKGMRPYAFNRKNQTKGWRQVGSNVSFEKRKLRYDCCQKEFYNLQFDYEFEQEFDQVYFAYCIPYSYTFLCGFLQSLNTDPLIKNYLRIDTRSESPCGLKIPILTITNFPEKDKKVVLITGRVHPGETQGSWMMHGLIKYLCSEEAKTLRDVVNFKIVPMVNVDGVLLGNFRTGLFGRDLNRLFKRCEPEKHYQVQYIKQLADQHKQKIQIYLDLHGHSTKKSIFIYGPEYQLGDYNYLISRMLPRLLSKQTQMFRYYGCKFKISKGKETTARAIMFRQYKFPFCYTVEASSHSYTGTDGEIIFSAEAYTDMGKIIGKCIYEKHNILSIIEARREEKRRVRQIKKQQPEPPLTERRFKKDSKRNYNRSPEPKSYLDNEEELFDNIKLLNQIKIEDRNQNQDLESEGSSDCQNREQDYTRQEIDYFMLEQKPKNHRQSSLLKKVAQKRDQNNKTLHINNPNISLPYRDMTYKKAVSFEKNLPQIMTLRPRQIQRVEQRTQAIRDKKSKWIYMNRTKNSSTIQHQRINQIQSAVEQDQKRDQRRNQRQVFDTSKDKFILKQGYVVNIRMQTEQQQELCLNVKSRSKSQLPQIRRNNLIKKRLEILTHQQIEIPNIVTEILKNQLRNQDKNKKLNKSIQVIRL